MTNTKLLNELIQQSGLKKAYIAEKIGVTPVGFSNLISGKAEFKASQINKMCDLLGIEDLELKEAVFFADYGALKAQK